MTLIRSGEARDVAAIEAMGRVRANPFRFHLDSRRRSHSARNHEKRPLAGLGPPGARQLHFFIAEEGVTAAAYVVISVALADRLDTGRNAATATRLAPALARFCRR